VHLGLCTLGLWTFGISDGVGKVLGSAGPDAAYYRGKEIYTASGSMTFDTADIDAPIAQRSFGDVILHEMAHVIGFGTLWGYNGVYVSNSGQYSGNCALSTYRTEFNQPTATFVPLELGGSAGTANSHWNEVDGGSEPPFTAGGRSRWRSRLRRCPARA
jgi:hypothetical protein